MIRVLVVDDDPLAAEAHAAYVERLDGFALAGVAHTASRALTVLRAAAGGPESVDLVLLDMTLPDAHGIEVARHLRAARIDVDIVAVTAVRELATVQSAVSLGVVQYLVKPFGFAAFREKLERYAEYRARLTGAGDLTQGEVDATFAALRGADAAELPKGLSGDTLERVSRHVRGLSDDGDASAAEVAERLDLSRVTARRYLEHLADLGVVVRAPRYGTPGRPEVAYRRRR